MASGRAGLSLCLAAQASTLSRSSYEKTDGRYGIMSGGTTAFLCTRGHMLPFPFTFIIYRPGGDLQSPRRKAAVIPALPGAYALWAVRAGCSVRNLWRAPCVSLTEPSTNHPNPYMRVPETPPGNLPLDCHTSGGVLVGEPARLTGAAGAIARHRLEHSLLRGRYFLAGGSLPAA